MDKAIEQVAKHIAGQPSEVKVGQGPLGTDTTLQGSVVRTSGPRTGPTTVVYRGDTIEVNQGFVFKNGRCVGPVKNS